MARAASSLKKLAAVLLGVGLIAGLAACGNPPPAGTESKPIYSGDLFDSRTVIEFASGEEMECFDLVSSSSDALFCDWAKAPKANLKLKDSLTEDWTLIFVELPKGVSVCLAKGWSVSPEKISCALNGVER